MSCGFSWMRTAAAQATSTRLFLRCAHRGFSSTPAESPVRLAIWGCGGVAEAHLNAAHKFGVDVEVTALVDTNAARIPIMHSLNVASNAIAYDTIDAALAEADVDVVAIFLPHNQHEHAAVKMLRTGKHVFLEKPMAPSVAECERIMAAAAEQGSLGVLFAAAAPCMRLYAWLGAQLKAVARDGTPYHEWCAVTHN